MHLKKITNIAICNRARVPPTLFIVFINDITNQLEPGVRNTLHVDYFAIWRMNTFQQHP